MDSEALAVRLERLEKQGVPARTVTPEPTVTPPPAATAPQPAVPTPEPVVKEEAKPEPATAPFVKDEPEPPAAAPAAAPPAAAPTTAAELDLPTYESAWPAIAARMRDMAGVSKHALLLEASPADVEGDTVVFELPDHLPFHLERLRADKELHQLLAQASAEFVGVNVGIRFEAKGDPAPPTAPDPQPVRAPDKEDLAEEDEGAIDPTSLVVDMLDGEILE